MKRLFDVFVAGAGLLLAAPICLLVAISICATIGRPVLFRQMRPGIHGDPFRMLKFRTMRDAYDHNGTELPDAERLTPLGQFFRHGSLDELPGLWNVLKGDMSLVGPRPLLMQYLPLYSPEQSRRHEVKPGLTGWAQTNGRNSLSWEEKFALDVWYVDNRSFWLDIKILFKTVEKVFRAEGISGGGEATMSPFTGTK